jgi:hypothetical protein
MRRAKFVEPFIRDDSFPEEFGLLVTHETITIGLAVRDFGFQAGNFQPRFERPRSAFSSVDGTH